MGQESVCTVRYSGQVSTGKALLETRELIFRGDFRLRVPLDGIKLVDVQDGVLTVAWPEGIAEFDLGPVAVKWEHKIKNPKSLVQKLGVKTGHRVALIGMNNPEFRTDLLKVTTDVVAGRTTKADVILIQCDRPADLQRVPALAAQIKPAGAVWVVYPKGHKKITQNIVFAAGKKAGLVDVKVVSFSESHTALKFVIPRRKR